MRFHFRAIALMLILGVFLLPPVAVSPAALRRQAERVEVMTWNLGGFENIPQARLERIAQVIARLQPDVAAVQEMSPASNFARLRDLLAGMNLGYEARFVAQEPGPDGIPRSRDRQMLGFFIREGVGISGVRIIPNSDDGRQRLRNALTARVKVRQFDFIIVNVHLKASRDPTSRATRTRQCAVIRRAIRRMTTGIEKDVLVVGDYNMIPGQDAANFEALNPPSFRLRFLSNALAGQASHINENGQGNLLDGYAIAEEHTREYSPDSLELVKAFQFFPDSTPRFYVRNVSDHLPLRATFDGSTDDDQ